MAIAISIAVLGPLVALVIFVVIQVQALGRGHWPAVDRGRAFLEQGRPDLALQAVQHVRDQAPGAGQAMTVAGFALIQMNEPKGSRLALERALKLEPNQLDAVKALAELSLRLGNGVRGVELLERATKLDPRDARLWVVIGRVCHDLGNTDKAAQAYDQALRLNPQDRETRLSLIEDLLNSNQPAQATAWVSEALKDQPDDARVLGLAARQARDLDHAQEASGLAERALARDPSNVDALLVRAEAFFAAGRDEGALADLERVLLASPNDLGALQLQAQVESRLGFSERAARSTQRHRAAQERAILMDQITQQIAQRPDDPEPRCNLGEAAAEAGQDLLAAQCFRAALALDPNNRPAKEGLAALGASPRGASPIPRRPSSFEVPQTASPSPFGRPPTSNHSQEIHK